jgi:hypothetical protein
MIDVVENNGHAQLNVEYAEDDEGEQPFPKKR